MDRTVVSPQAALSGFAYRLILKGAQLVPLPVQRLVRSGPIGKVMRFLLDRVTPAGRYEVLPVRSGLMEGTLLQVDVRKQRDMIAGTYESEVQRVLAQHLHPGDVAFDVGAHLGFFTLLVARLVGDGGKVVSVEPDPFMGPRLESNLQRNDAANVTVVRAAAGAVASERRFTPGDGGGIGHLSDEGAIEVSGTTLDALAGTFGAPKLVKVDVEGGELEVLRGAAGVLANSQPVLVVEVHDDGIGAELEKMLSGLPYRIEYIRDDPSSRRHLVAVPA